VRCRTLLTQAAQEISSLQREVWQLERQLNWARSEQSDGCDNSAAMTSGSSLAGQRHSQLTPLYAVAPIGRIEPTQDEPKLRSEPIFLNRYPVITNLGTMVDVLM
jgi:hypothetical protein